VTRDGLALAGLVTSQPDGGTPTPTFPVTVVGTPTSGQIPAWNTSTHQWEPGASPSATYAAIYRDRPQLYKPGGLRRWDVALSDARNTLAKIMVLGDSITLGVGSDNSGSVSESATYVANAWPRVLQKQFTPYYGDPGEGYIKMDDYRWAFGGAASTTRQDFSPQRKARQMVATSTATITLPLGTTEFDVWFWDASGQKFGVQVDGGATTTYTLGSTSLPGSRTVTGLAGGSTHTVIITADATNGSNFYLSGVVVRAANTGVQVSRLGESGADSGYITGLTQSGFVNGTQFAALSAGAVTSLMLATFEWSPHLTILPIGVNDASQQADSGVTPTIYAANLQRLITEATVTRSGAVLLLLGPRLASAATPYTEDQFWTQAYALADANDHVAVLNIADKWGTQAAAQALGFSIASSVHPNRPGHGNIARAVYSALTAPGLAA
jgi:lysophospholipase L1-like esterase